MSELVRYQIEDHIALIEMNDPESRNSMSQQMCYSLIDALKAAEANDNVHVIVLTGAGNAFCAGGNLKEFSQYQEKLLSFSFFCS